MKCNNCGSELKPGAAFCENCGMILSVDTPEESGGAKDVFSSGTDPDKAAEFDAIIGEDVLGGFGSYFPETEEEEEEPLFEELEPEEAPPSQPETPAVVPPVIIPEPEIVEEPVTAEAAQPEQPETVDFEETPETVEEPEQTPEEPEAEQIPEEAEEAFEDVSSFEESPAEEAAAAAAAAAFAGGKPEEPAAGTPEPPAGEKPAQGDEDDYFVPAKKKNSKGAVVAAIIVVLIVAVGAGAMSLKNGSFDLRSLIKKSTTETSATSGESKTETTEKKTTETVTEKSTESTTEPVTEPSSESRTSGSGGSSGKTSAANSTTAATTKSTTKASTTASTTKASTTAATTKASTTAATTTKASTTAATTTKASTTAATTTKASTTKASTTKPKTTEDGGDTEPTEPVQLPKPELIEKLGLPAIPVGIKTPDKFLKAAYIAYVSAKNGTRMFKEPSIKAEESGRSRIGRELQVLAQDGKWSFVFCAYYGRYGWVRTANFSETRPVSDETIKVEGLVEPTKKQMLEKEKKMTVSVGSSVLLLRKTPDAEAENITALEDGTPVTVLALKGDYAYVREPMSGFVGWVTAKYLK